MLVGTVEPVQRRRRLAQPVSVQRPGGRRHDPGGEDRSRVPVRLAHGGDPNEALAQLSQLDARLLLVAREHKDTMW